MTGWLRAGYHKLIKINLFFFLTYMLSNAILQILINKGESKMHMTERYTANGITPRQQALADVVDHLYYKIKEIENAQANDEMIGFTKEYRNAFKKLGAKMLDELQAIGGGDHDGSLNIFSELE
tara:strand:+ start:190 stop:561 length:372 start_codon:yes stop_codon:yes gene_type:complete